MENNQENIVNISTPKDLIISTWDIYSKKIGVLTGILAVPFILSYLSGYFYEINQALAAILSFTYLVAFFWAQVAILFVIIDQKEVTSFQVAVQKGWSKILPFFWLSLLSLFIIIGGFFLMIIPGIIFYVWFLFPSFILIVENKGGMDAFMRSKQLVTGYWLKIFGRTIFLFALVFLFISPIILVTMLIPFINTEIVSNLISSFIGTPIVLIFSYLIYKDLIKIKLDTPAVVATTKDRVKFLTVGLIGWIIGLIIIVSVIKQAT